VIKKLYDLFQIVASYTIQLSVVCAQHRSQTSPLAGHIYLSALLWCLCWVLYNLVWKSWLHDEVQGSAWPLTRGIPL